MGKYRNWKKGLLWWFTVIHFFVVCSSEFHIRPHFLMLILLKNE